MQEFYVSPVEIEGETLYKLRFWRDNGEEGNVTELIPGTAIDIPVGTRFQYRNIADDELKFICIAMPPWPGDAEASYVEGIWEPTV